MKKRLIIIGNGGHGKVCAEIAELNGYTDIAFIDDRITSNASVIGKCSDYIKYIDNDFFVAIGDNAIRKMYFERISQLNGNIISLIHPNCVISKSATFGAGTVVMAGAVINAGTVIGNGAIINTCSSIDHNCIVEDFSHVSVGTHIAGSVHIGELCFIGAGVTIINNLSVCSNCVIGAGAVVIRDIIDAGTYIGIPAKLIKSS